MNKKIALILSIFILSLFIKSTVFSDNSFITTHEKGWHWYEPVEIAQEQEEIAQIPSALKPKIPAKDLKPKAKNPTQIMESYKKELQNRLAAAWLNPSAYNIQRYQVMQKDMLDRSQSFSKGWMESVFLNPSLDYTIANPVNQKARHVKLDLDKKQTLQTIENLSKEYGLFFFFSSGCDFCHEFAPIVKAFADKYNWDVLAISMDGGGIEGFKNVQRDNGLYAQWGVEVLPALFAVNPNTGHVIPIAFGMISIDQMEDRIMALVNANTNISDNQNT